MFVPAGIFKWLHQQADKKRIDLVLGGSIHFFPHMENLKAIWEFGLNYPLKYGQL